MFPSLIYWMIKPRSCCLVLPQLGLEAEVSHMMGPVTLHFLMEKPVDSVTTRLKSQPEVDSQPLMATTPLNTTFPLPLSTPIRINSSTTLPFTTHNRCRIESCTTMAAEMQKYLVGPMPVQQFLDLFFPVEELPHVSDVPQFKAGDYHATIKVNSEANAYDPFVSSATY